MQFQRQIDHPLNAQMEAARIIEHGVVSVQKSDRTKSSTIQANYKKNISTAIKGLFVDDLLLEKGQHETHVF